jgi:hypothetical protein
VRNCGLSALLQVGRDELLKGLNAKHKRAELWSAGQIVSHAVTRRIFTISRILLFRINDRNITSFCRVRKAQTSFIKEPDPPRIQSVRRLGRVECQA